MKVTKNIFKIVLITFLLLTSFVVINIYFVGNFYKLDKNAFRSGQLYRHNMPYYLKKHKIKSILNLTLSNPKDPDYITEVALAKKFNVKIVNFRMTSGGYLDFSKTSKLVNFLQNIEKPVLIHCFHGADRTSLAAALYDYAILGKSENEARKQLGILFGHAPILRPKVIAMDKSFDNYINNEKSKDNFSSP